MNTVSQILRTLISTGVRAALLATFVAGTIIYADTVKAGPTDRLVVEGTSGNIGMGTALPQKQLHILGADTQGTTNNNVQLRIENNATTTDFRNMLTLVNNGDPRLVYINSSTGVTWSQNPIAGAFRITRNGSGVFEMSVFEGGNVTIGGILTQSSDKAGKENFKDLNADEVLQALVEMPITEWSYKSSPEERHIGPVAQDFYAAFGLGVDDKHLSPSDVASVSVLAIQAQQKTIDAQSETIDSQTVTINSQSESIDLLMRELAKMKREIKEIKAEVTKHQAQTAAASQASTEPGLQTVLASTSQ